MCCNSTTLETISHIVYNFVIPASLIIGGIWTLNIFSKRKENAALLVKLKNVKPIYVRDLDKYFYQIEVLLKNTGLRDLDLDYTRACMTVSDYDFHKHKVGAILDSQNGLTSNEKHFLGRLRSNVQIKLPYLLLVDKPGLHFFEFKISVDMKRYFKGTFKNEKGPNKKEWSDRFFYTTKKSDFKKS
jgi:hypothetical protein